ncbi:MAG: hypothetical protein L6R42_010264 [Xanthoria sp. 1 TBL-2021]|nr:MAG: hypothetical protein L6R42_010264 [Xanthoria sp. 1 TBL-2021]
MNELDFSKRKVVRQRTLLSDVNDIKVTKVVELQESQVPVKVYEKNPQGKKVTGSQATNGAAAQVSGRQAGKEEAPASNRPAEVFMEMGGKGDPALFEDDHSSRYRAAERDGRQSDANKEGKIRGEHQPVCLLETSHLVGFSVVASRVHVFCTGDKEGVV